MNTLVLSTTERERLWRKLNQVLVKGSGPPVWRSTGSRWFRTLFNRVVQYLFLKTNKRCVLHTVWYFIPKYQLLEEKSEMCSGNMNRWRVQRSLLDFTNTFCRLSKSHDFYWDSLTHKPTDNESRASPHSAWLTVGSQFMLDAAGVGAGDGAAASCFIHSSADPTAPEVCFLPSQRPWEVWWWDINMTNSPQQVVVRINNRPSVFSRVNTSESYYIIWYYFNHKNTH